MSNKEKKKEAVLMLNGKPFKVPPGGSLGVLALGAVGVRAWKKVKKEYEDRKNNGKEE